MPELPVPFDGNPPSRRTWRLARSADDEVASHALRAWVMVMKDEIDTEALSDALMTSLQEECRFVDEGLRLAGNSAFKAQLVENKAALLATTDNRRIRRRFVR